MHMASMVKKTQYVEGRQNHLRLRAGSAFPRAGLKIRSSEASATFNLANRQSLPVECQLSAE